jgi:pseudouridylate synthase
MRGFLEMPARVGEAVHAALSEGRAVVALETTLIVHGLPRPDNLRIARELEDAVSAAGAVPATIGVVSGAPVVGLSPRELERLTTSDEPVAKLSARDLGFAAERGIDGATTVASTITLAALAGISVMANGGIGGVHRGAKDTFDESADLFAIHDQSVLVVCSGVKSILDAAATLERLESLSVPVGGYRTDAFPGFYVKATALRVGWRVESPSQAAVAFRSHRTFAGTGMVLANPVPDPDALADDVHAAALAFAEDQARAAGVLGKDVTPFLLARFAEYTKGESVRTNRALALANATLAGEIAVELAGS